MGGFTYLTLLDFCYTIPILTNTNTMVDTLDQLKREIEGNKRELKTKEGVVSKIEADIANKESELARLKTELTRAQGERDGIQQEITRHQSEMEKLAKDLKNGQ